MKMVNCRACGMRRQHHAKGYCSDCYHTHARPERPKGICVDPMCPNRGYGFVEIIGRGLCRTCYNRNYWNGSIKQYPKKQERGSGLSQIPGLTTA